MMHKSKQIFNTIKTFDVKTTPDLCQKFCESLKMKTFIVSMKTLYEIFRNKFVRMKRMEYH